MSKSISNLALLLVLLLPALRLAADANGAYVGLDAGLALGSSTMEESFNPGLPGASTLNELLPAQSVGSGNVNLGIHGGYDWQFGPWLVGAAADFGSTGLVTAKDTSFVYSGSTVDSRQAYDSTWLLTLRPRVGYDLGKAIVWLTAGLSLSSVHDEQQLYVNGSLGTAASTDYLAAGWNAGLGVEVPVNSHWSAGLNYLYNDFGSESYATNYGAPTLGTSLNNVYNTAHLYVNLFRLSADYRF